MSLDGQQDVQFSKVHLPAERNWTDICKGPEHLLWMCGIPGVSTDPQVRLLSFVLKSLPPTGADATKQSQCAGQSWRHGQPFLELASFRAFAFTVTYVVRASLQSEFRKHCRLFLRPCYAPGEEIAETSEPRKTKRENKAISIKLSLLILNLEERDINLLGPRSLKTKLLPVDVGKWSSASLDRLVVCLLYCRWV